MTAQAPVMLIDGRSGSGKTELARVIAHANPSVQLVRLDDLYPGWNGLADGSARVREHVLTQRRWQRWDWAASEFAEWHSVDPARPLIVEGCGALSAANRTLADYGIWVELEPSIRRQRALLRDGSIDWWDGWAAQEDAFIAHERPDELADEIVRGDVAPDAPQLARWRAVLDPARVAG